MAGTAHAAFGNVQNQLVTVKFTSIHYSSYDMQLGMQFMLAFHTPPVLGVFALSWPRENILRLFHGGGKLGAKWLYEGFVTWLV